MMVQNAPTIIAPQPLTQPAQGVMPTRPTDHAVHRPEEGRFPRVGEPAVHRHPGEHAGGSRDIGVDHGVGHVDARVVRVATVEAVPAEPQDAGTDRGDEKVVGYEVLSVSRQPGTEDPGRNEARDPGRHVDDEAAGEVESTFLGEVAAAPQHESVDAVDEGRPQRDQDAPGTELDTAEHAPDEQQGRDGSEDKLEVEERVGREVEGDDGVGRGHRLALFLGGVGDRARSPDKVREEVLEEPPVVAFRFAGS